ncbi:hypothetical protein [Proteiniphilum sp. X52]|nr:hypothetical protein [Proteiniphilum sp. X52]
MHTPIEPLTGSPKINKETHDYPASHYAQARVIRYGTGSMPSP